MPRKKADPEESKQALKKEIIRLGIQDNPSRTVYQKNYHRGEAPSPNNVIKVTGMKWKELVNELGFSYDTKKIYAKSAKKEAKKRKGMTYGVSLSSAINREKVVNQALELIKKEKIDNVDDFKLRCRAELNVPYATLVRHHYSFETLKELYEKKYGEKIINSKSGKWVGYSNQELLNMVIDYMKQNNVSSLSEYNYEKDATDVPSARTLTERFNMTFGEMSKMINAML